MDLIPKSNRLSCPGCSGWAGQWSDSLFPLQARCLRDTEHIFREGPIEIGLPCSIKGEARLPCVPAPGKKGSYPDPQWNHCQ